VERYRSTDATEMGNRSNGWNTWASCLAASALFDRGPEVASLLHVVGMKSATSGNLNRVGIEKPANSEPVSATK
jgi:hypothetical protein